MEQRKVQQSKRTIIHKWLHLITSTLLSRKDIHSIGLQRNIGWNKKEDIITKCNHKKRYYQKLKHIRLTLMYSAKAASPQPWPMHTARPAWLCCAPQTRPLNCLTTGLKRSCLMEGKDSRVCTNWICWKASKTFKQM